MHLLMTMPSKLLLPVVWHRDLSELWIYQCPKHLYNMQLYVTN